MNKKITLLLTSVFISGCVSGNSKVEAPKKLNEPTPILSDPNKTEITSQKEVQLGRIVFYRQGILGLAIVPKIKVNGQQYGKVPAASYFSCDIPAGIYEIESKTENTANLTVEVKAAETQYIRTSIQFGVLIGRVLLEKSDNATGQKRISKLKQTSSTCGL